MIIKHVKIENFLVFENVSLDVGKGLFFVTGENRDDVSSDSNGAGKSTFCQSIVWCLFGSVLRKNLNLDDLIGDSKDYAYVEVELELDNKGDSLQVVVGRGRNHPDIGNGIFIEVDGEEKTFHKKKDAQNYIYELLDISPDIVFQSAYFDESEKSFVELTPANLRDKVCNLLDIDRFDEYLTNLRRVRCEKENEIENKQSKIPEVEERIGDVKENIGKYNRLIDNFDERKQRELEKLQDELEELEEQRRKKQEEISDKSELKKRRDELEEKKAGYKDVNIEFEKLEKQKGIVQDKIDKLDDEIYEVKSDYESAKNSLSNLRDNVTGECNYCGNKLTDSDKLKEKSEHFEEKRDDLYAELMSLEVDKEGAGEKLEEINDRLDELQHEMDKRNDIIQDLDSVKRKLETYERIEKEIHRLDDKCDKKQKEIRGKKQESPENFREMLSDSKEKKEKLEKQVDNLYTSVDKLELQINASDVLEEALEEIRSSLFNNFIYKLKDLINYNFDEMTGGDYRCCLSVDKKDRFQFEFINSGKRKYYPYSAFSSGEQARIKKAVAIALNNLMDVGFIVDDEGLSGLDAQGADDVIEFLFDEFEETTGLFISHRSQVQNKCVEGVSNIHIIKENGKSTAKIEE